MRLLRQKPQNSKIEITDELNKTVIFWKNPRGSASRYLVLIFLLAWLGGWAVGFYSAGKGILEKEIDPFLIFWMIAWTVGGIFAIRTIYFIARPAKPEKLILNYDSLIFEAGTPIFEGIEWNISQKNQDEKIIPANSETKYKVPKNQIGDINLDRIGERQRLSFDFGAERVEVGFYLTEPEREWLYTVLKDWRGV